MDDPMLFFQFLSQIFTVAKFINKVAIQKLIKKNRFDTTINHHDEHTSKW